MSIIILQQNQTNSAYIKAAKTFQSLYERVTGIRIDITDKDDGISDIVCIGSDAVNDFLTNEVLSLRLGSLGIRYGTDDYCIRSHKNSGRNVLILAGGRVRSTFYAIYDYFERFGGCHYFWDGDVIGRRDTLPMENLDITESPRFQYRGLRYFAHRGLKRFQAEHWSFEDWKTEIDWMIKKRLNFFMLRIGMDDIWQRAFPDAVPYPDGFRTIGGPDARGYNDRSDFWTLKYRGELRERILGYAREMDLIYPVDCGTMTHWYSRTPAEFLENKKPPFVTQEIGHYASTDSGKVFDFTKKEGMDYYMHLTETMVREHERTSALFHTIGLGERRMYKDKNKNFALKLVAYRKILENIRQRYPDSKLMLASWDFIGWWSPEEVKRLIGELDPEQTIIMDYTSDVNDPDNNFTNWGIVGKFPWIFGLFHAYESENELRGPYDRSDERLQIAANDPYCKGMILWPELSHSDPLILEYLSQNAWSPLEKTVEEIAENFCKNRYGAYSDYMNACWQRILPFIKLGDWGGYCQRREGDEDYARYCSSWYAHQDIWSKPIEFLLSADSKDDTLKKYFEYKTALTMPLLDGIIGTLKGLASEPRALKDQFILRDSIDIARTVLGRFMNYIFAEAWAERGGKEQIQALKEHYLELMDIMAELLSITPDFSLYHTLKALQATAPTNPNFEITLKKNICNRYCAQGAYELITCVLKDEGAAAFDWMMTSSSDSAQLKPTQQALYSKFMDIPLEQLQPAKTPAPARVILKAAAAIERVKI